MTVREIVPTFQTWDDFYSGLRWEQGEHVTLIGPTGLGKTTMIRALLPKRRYVVFVATKPRDSTVDKLEAQGFRVTRRWSPQYDRTVLWPRLRDPADIATQRAEVAAMLDDAYRQGGWTVVLDELRYVTDFLKLSRPVQLLLLQGRSLGVSVVSGSQRPRYVPLEAYSQARHLFLWKTRDRQDLMRLGDFSGNVSPVEVGRALRLLPDRYACLYLGADGKLAITKAPS